VSAPVPDLAARVERLRERLVRAEARRDAAADQLASVSAQVAAAKGRLLLREPVEGLLTELQEEASRRSVASFEALLTALVAEVLPGEHPVALDLSTERGQAALDIGLLRPDGVREDVLEDHGGALTNVVGMALRLIAVVKAGLGRFLALDEADCWIAPERVPAFYRVLEDGAARLGVQCLAISHHDVAAFGGTSTVRRIRGEPRTGVAVEGGPLPWPDGAPGFRHVRLVDVQGYADATLHLGPGVNALVGPNNRGKSTFVRALRAVFYGEARDSLVRAGASAATIEIGVAGGRTLRFVRQPRRTPVNLWSLHEPDGAVAVEGGARLESGGRSPPDWVGRLFGISRIEELDVHVAHQKFPVFLLGEPPSKRSAVLSIGREAGYIRDMQAIQRERVAADLRAVREGEARVAALQDELAAFADLDDLAAEVEAARALAAAAAEAGARLDGIARRAEALSRAERARARARARAAAFADLPPPDELADLRAAGAEARTRARTGRRLLDLADALALARARTDALADLPGEVPMRLLDPRPSHLAGRLAALGRDLTEAGRRRDRALRDAEGLAAETEALLAATGGLCPACGAPAGADALLSGHRHPGMEAA
jgi:hypothetical protein